MDAQTLVRHFSREGKPNLNHERAYVVAEPSTRKFRCDLRDTGRPAHSSDATRSRIGEEEKKGDSTT